MKYFTFAAVLGDECSLFAERVLKDDITRPGVSKVVDYIKRQSARVVPTLFIYISYVIVYTITYYNMIVQQQRRCTVKIFTGIPIITSPTSSYKPLYVLVIAALSCSGYLSTISLSRFQLVI